MILRNRVNHTKGSGYVTVYEDDSGKYVVAVSVDNQRSLYPKVFEAKETALKHAQFIIRNWVYHIKATSPIRLTPIATL